MSAAFRPLARLWYACVQVLFAIGSDEWASSAAMREWLQLAGVPKAQDSLTLCLVRLSCHVASACSILCAGSYRRPALWLQRKKC